MPYTKNFNIRLDAKYNSNNSVMDVVQEDNLGNKLSVQMYQDGSIVDLTDADYATITVLKSDKTTVVATATITNASEGRLEYVLSQQCLGALGLTRATIEVYSINVPVDIRVTSGTFIYNTIEDLYQQGSGAITSSSDYPVLLDLIASVQAAGANEGERIANELVRVASEVTRLASEGTRVASETTRETNESTRQSQESTRKTNETNRESVESTRVTNDIARESNESARQTNETTRQSQESTRVINEATRISQETDRETLINNTKYIEEYNELTQYYKNNITSFNGYSYIALQNNLGNYPPNPPIINNQYWGMVSSRGSNGADLVYRGLYDTGATYAVNDLARKGTILYNCILASTGNDPSSSPTYWEVFLEGGGDMVKSIYDINADGIVDYADLAYGLIEDATQRTVTDIQINTWDGKADQSSVNTNTTNISTNTTNIATNTSDIAANTSQMAGLAGIGRTTETVKGNADTIVTNTSQMADLVGDVTGLVQINKDIVILSVNWVDDIVTSGYWYYEVTDVTVDADTIVDVYFHLASLDNASDIKGVESFLEYYRIFATSQPISDLTADIKKIKQVGGA